eukprot:1894999-Alexandrium_andersonii.AAC.1
MGPAGRCGGNAGRGSEWRSLCLAWCVKGWRLCGAGDVRWWAARDGAALALAFDGGGWIVDVGPGWGGDADP